MPHPKKFEVPWDCKFSQPCHPESPEDMEAHRPGPVEDAQNVSLGQRFALGSREQVVADVRKIVPKLTGEGGKNFGNIYHSN